MPWVQSFPTGPTLISDSVNQIGDNWLFLQDEINTDHFFNTGAPTEGHHRYLVTENRTDPASLQLDAMLYSKVSGRGNELAFKNSQSVRTLVARYAGREIFPAAGIYTLVGPNTDFSQVEPCFGMIFVMAEDNSGRGYAMFANDGQGNFVVNQRFVAGTITGIFNLSTILSFQVSAAVTIQYYYIRNNWV